MQKGKLKDTLKLAAKIEIKKEDKNIEATEKAINKIHSTQGSIVRVSLDFPEALYTMVKQKVATERKTLRGYLLALVENDI